MCKYPGKRFIKFIRCVVKAVLVRRIDPSCEDMYVGGFWQLRAIYQLSDYGFSFVILVVSHGGSKCLSMTIPGGAG